MQVKIKKEIEKNLKIQRGICYSQILTLIISIFAFASLVSIFLLENVNASGGERYCCEKTSGGALCQDVFVRRFVELFYFVIDNLCNIRIWTPSNCQDYKTLLALG